MLLNCGIREDSLESLGEQGDQTIQSLRKSTLNIHWKDWCWSWKSNTLTTWCVEMIHWKISWFWERLKAGGEGDNRGWGSWMASPTRWTWVWVTLRVGDRQGSLVCCSPSGLKELDTTEWLNWTDTSVLVSVVAGSVIKSLPVNPGDSGSVLTLRISPEGGNGNPL